VDIAGWLRGLGLERYEQAFRDNAIDDTILPKLTADDLKDIGVTVVGHRRRMLEAIAVLDAGDDRVPSSAAESKIAPAPVPKSATPAMQAERRQLTVMFVDLVGSTALAHRLDPEEMGNVLRAYHEAVEKVVARFGGHIAKFMGDGVLVYFGYPQAHEDDAERALRAGLELTEDIGELRTQERLQARIGIATGLVVVGDLIGAGEAQERGVIGETPNLAARLQAIAEPGAVIIASSTRRLIGNLFECRDLGAVKVKGIVEPVQAWQALRTSAVESRFEAFHLAALTPVVGRAEEIDLLLRRWQRAKSGDGQVVLLSGEPGIGKSRIGAALEEQLQAEIHTRLRCFCSPYHGDSALHPIITQLERAAEFKRADPPEVKLDKLEALLTPMSPREDDVALLAELLSLPASDRYPPLNLSPQQKKQKTFDALVWRLESLARQQPVLVVYEDVHWIDPTSFELLDLEVERVRSLPVLFVITSRPEFRPPWVGQAHVTALTLNRLGRREGMALVERIAGNKALSTEIVDEIVERTDGIPLFVEELTKAVLEAGEGDRDGRQVVTATPRSTLAVPATLHASLLARLDRVGSSAKEIAQIGAAIGREFSYELIQAVAALDEQSLANALGRLVASELLFQHGSTPEATYIFKHALVQDTTYSTLLRSKRQELHGRIAQVLQEHFPETAELQPEVLARHFTEAKRVDRAIGYWLKAGQLANDRSTSREAVSHLTKGLDLLRELANDPGHDRIELALQSTIGPALVATKGYAAPETVAAYERARELMRATNEFSQQGGVLIGLFTGYYGNRPNLR
jgi:class 3 adenylate cyclase